ncbi:MAG TPA: dienelactone hydrolase family protein [Acidimicrobiales bacterium]|nr:dienelactone hydrolase family protein [Acidimicrobiales bacterium]
MEITTRYERITANDHGEFDAFCALPESGSGPGVLLFQEIFGINDNIRDLAARLAAEGYVVLAPDMFWRIEPRFERKDESSMGDAMATVQQFDFMQGVDDIVATHKHLLAMPECSGKVGAVGFCLGGGLAFAAAALSRVEGRGPDAAVCYYGSPVNSLLEHADAANCALMFHYGDNDPFIARNLIDEVENAFKGRDNVRFHRYDAGHAFSNNDAPSMYDESAATEAWDRTLEFFHETLA